MFLKQSAGFKNVQKIVCVFVGYVLLLATPLTVWTQIKGKKGSRSDNKPLSTSKSNNRGKSYTGNLNLGKVHMAFKKQLVDGEIQGTPWRGEDGITETVAEIMERQKRTPKKPYSDKIIEKSEREKEWKPTGKKHPPNEMNIPRYPYNPEDDNQVEKPVSEFQTTVGTSIAGPVLFTDSSSIPPDSMGDVGPTQVLMHANGRIKVYSKAGVLGSLDADDDVFWSSVRNGAGVSDPHIEYDRLSGRWFLCIINIQSAPNRVLLAVSSGATIASSASFTFFQFTHDAIGTTPNTDTGGFADYPTFGIDANAVYMGMNIFNAAGTALIGTTVYVFNKTNLMSGTLTVTPFRQIGAAAGSGAGPWTPQGADNDDPTFTTGYFVGVDNASFSLLNVRRVSTPGGTPTLSGNLNITVPTTTFPMGFGFTTGVPYQGATSSRTLDDLDDRLFAARIQKNRLTGAITLTTAHNIEVNTSGTGSSTGNRDGSRWYEIENLTTTPSLRQSGTVFDSAASNQSSFWIPSIAMSGQGHMAIAMSSAGLARFPSIFAAGRLGTDTLGTNGTPSATQIQASTTTYNLEAAGSKQRWGDYSQTTVDPCDNQSFWTVQEYCDAANSWRMRAIQLRAEAPTFSTRTPSTTATGIASKNIEVTGTGFFDNEATFTCNASCSGTGTGTCRMIVDVTSSPIPQGDSPSVALTVNSVTWNSASSITVNINTVGATPGVHTLRIRNPDGQSVNFTLTLATPTATTAAIGGKVTNPQGNPVNGVSMRITDVSTGEVSTVTTDAGGRYDFPTMLVGQDYIIAPSKGGLTFNPPNRAYTHNGAVTNLDFVAESNAASQSVFNDFDGDGKTDIAVYRANEGRWYIKQSSNGQMRVEQWGLAKDLLTPADFDGDSKTDVAIYRPQQGTWFIRQSSDGSAVIIPFGTNGDIPVAGNFDGDNRADLAVYRPSEGNWYVLQSSNGQSKQLPFGAAEDRPVPRDFDGDGRTDFGIYRPGEGMWYVLYSSNNSTSSVPFGVVSDSIAPGDYDGDARADYAVFRPESGAWFILPSSNQSAEIRLFGRNNDKVVAGDYNGDGITDIALYRPSDSNWYIRTTDGGFISEKFGLPDDIPAVPTYMR